jgi:hypothetical protein
MFSVFDIPENVKGRAEMGCGTPVAMADFLKHHL